MYIEGREYFAVIKIDSRKTEKKMVKCTKVGNKYAYFGDYLRVEKYQKNGEESREFYECSIYQDESHYFDEVERIDMANRVHDKLSSQSFRDALRKMPKDKLEELKQLAAKYSI